MSRLDAALRRARGNRPEPEAFEGPSGKALDWFAQSEAAAAAIGADGVVASTAVADAPADAEDALLNYPSVPDADEPRSDARTRDARRPEARTPDARTTDARTPEARTPDARRPDAHRPDLSGPATDPATEAAPAPAARKSPETPPAAAVKSANAHRLITSELLRPVTVEQYRRIAAVLHHVHRDRGVQVVMVSSAVPGEGKTLTASNLALTMSQSYQRNVLLIDADLRRPTVHDTFGVPNSHGLTDVLDAVDDVAPRFVEVMDHLTVLPAGAPNPDPLSGLTSGRMKQLVANARAQFDWVIIDTPPVGVLPDANLLGGIVDTALLVVSAGRTPLRIIQEAINALGRERILGVILNRVELKNIAGHYAGYGGYGYGYGYGESGKKKRGYFSKA